jgi:hypothetical protein
MYYPDGENIQYVTHRQPNHILKHVTGNVTKSKFLKVYQIPTNKATKSIRKKKKAKRIRPSAHGATQKKLTGHANYQPVTSELLSL